MASSLPPKYHELLSNGAINYSVTKAGPLTSKEVDILRRKITELEASLVATWDQYYHPPPFEGREIREMWLQQIAFSLYVEANRKVPWSITTYSPEALNSLLAYSDFIYPSIETQFYVFNPNPLIPHAYGFEMLASGNGSLTTPTQLLFSVVKRMRSDGWAHISGVADRAAYTAACSRPTVDFICLREVQKGTSTHTPLFIKAILAAYNIPSVLVRPYFGHGGIIFPSLSLAMDGDAVYNAVLAGFTLKFGVGLAARPSKIPVENSFTELSVILQWLSMPLCKGAWQVARKGLLDYFKLWDKPEWNSDLIATFRDRPLPFLRTAGDLAAVTNPSSFCQTTDPTLDNYWEPPISDAEFNDFLAKIKSLP
jgi:hypothetical protein